MREILFRGKTLGGEWVQGYYIKATHHWHNHGIHKDWIATDTIQNGGRCNVRGKYAVIPESVSEFTGLTDKNGKKIFEGDIIQTKPKYRFLVKYGGYMPNEFCKFEYKDRESFGLFLTDGKADFQMSNYSPLYEVIGNIHDNPELLKGENDA